MLDGTKWLLIAEINNEADGGESPATVRSALESVRGGYNPDPDELVDEEPIQRELEEMVQLGQGDDLAENLLTDADWQEYSDGDLQARARKGH
jgi:hypothetical protein